MTVIAVMAGGAVGAALRYGLSQLMNPADTVGMPWGTLNANIVGCLLIGWLATTFSDASEAVRMGILVGVLGGFTTFSSFGLETIRMVQAGEWFYAITYVLLSNIGGLLAVFLGLKIAS